MKNLNELQMNTLLSATGLGAMTVMLFVCIFRVSNATALVIIGSAAVLGCVSLLTTSPWRYALLAVLVGILAAELILREHASGLVTFSVLARFTLTGLLIAFFATRLSARARKIYLDMKRLVTEREQALDQLSKWLARGNALLVVIRAISTKNRLQDIFTESLAEARKVFNADSGLIYSVDRETGSLSIMGSFGYSPEILEKMNKKWSTSGDVRSCEACASREVVAVENLATDLKCDNLQKVESGSCICLPIITEGKLFGVLHLRRSHTDAFSRGEIQLAEAMAYQFGLAIERASLFEQVNHLAITDPITGLYNYRKLARDMERELVRSRRYRRPFSFIMADIDLFKQINDEYGHLAGDKALREIARVLEEGRREVDRVYRYAGDEFCLLLPETDLPEAFELAEKLRRTVAELDIPVDGRREPVHATISLGVTAFSDALSLVDDLISEADQALYTAKESGRNSVFAFTNPERLSRGTDSVGDYDRLRYPTMGEEL